MRWLVWLFTWLFTWLVGKFNRSITWPSETFFGGNRNGSVKSCLIPTLLSLLLPHTTWHAHTHSQLLGIETGCVWCESEKNCKDANIGVCEGWGSGHCPTPAPAPATKAEKLLPSSASSGSSAPDYSKQALVFAEREIESAWSAVEAEVKGSTAATSTPASASVSAARGRVYGASEAAASESGSSAPAVAVEGSTRAASVCVLPQLAGVVSCSGQRWLVTGCLGLVLTHSPLKRLEC